MGNRLGRRETSPPQVEPPQQMQIEGPPNPMAKTLKVIASTSLRSGHKPFLEPLSVGLTQSWIDDLAVKPLEWAEVVRAFTNIPVSDYRTERERLSPKLFGIYVNHAVAKLQHFATVDFDNFHYKDPAFSIIGSSPSGFFFGQDNTGTMVPSNAFFNWKNAPDGSKAVIPTIFYDVVEVFWKLLVQQDKQSPAYKQAWASALMTLNSTMQNCTEQTRERFSLEDMAQGLVSSFLSGLHSININESSDQDNIALLNKHMQTACSEYTTHTILTSFSNDNSECLSLLHEGLGVLVLAEQIANREIEAQKCAKEALQHEAAMWKQLYLQSQKTQEPNDDVQQFTQRVQPTFAAASQRIQIPLSYSMATPNMVPSQAQQMRNQLAVSQPALLAPTPMALAAPDEVSIAPEAQRTILPPVQTQETRRLEVARLAGFLPAPVMDQDIEMDIAGPPASHTQFPPVSRPHRGQPGATFSARGDNHVEQSKKSRSQRVHQNRMGSDT